MDVLEVKKLREKLEVDISDLIQVFEKQTNMDVVSVSTIIDDMVGVEVRL